MRQKVAARTNVRFHAVRLQLARPPDKDSYASVMDGRDRGPFASACRRNCHAVGGRIEHFGRNRRS